MPFEVKIIESYLIYTIISNELGWVKEWLNTTLLIITKGFKYSHW